MKKLLVSILLLIVSIGYTVDFKKKNILDTIELLQRGLKIKLILNDFKNCKKYFDLNKKTKDIEKELNVFFKKWDKPYEETDHEKIKKDLKDFIKYSALNKKLPREDLEKGLSNHCENMLEEVNNNAFQKFDQERKEIEAIETQKQQDKKNIESMKKRIVKVIALTQKGLKQKLILNDFKNCKKYFDLNKKVKEKDLIMFNGLNLEIIDKQRLEEEINIFISSSVLNMKLPKEVLEQPLPYNCENMFIDTYYNVFKSVIDEERSK